MSVRPSISALLLALVLASGGCAAEPGSGDPDPGASGEDALVQRQDDEYFYDGPFSALEDAKVTVSLRGHTARVSGYLASVPDGVGDLPNVKTKAEGSRVRVDVVYPIATARPGKTNSRPGTYAFHQAKPYRPDGSAFTAEEGEHFVTWGGFPFVAYNRGIAFHGPITSEVAGATRDVKVWFLKRGAVSGGCNRMMGEHVVELSHLIGVSMRKVYAANAPISTPRAPVTVLPTDQYDTYEGKLVDVDYATDVGVTRPGKVYGDDRVVMFGSWVASETPDGKDLPPDAKWEGGVAGRPYVFREHARTDMICSFAKRDLPALKTLAATFPNGELPRGICAKKACVVDALRAGADAKARCRLGGTTAP
jgi:hypothetical protein